MTARPRVNVSHAHPEDRRLLPRARRKLMRMRLPAALLAALTVGVSVLILAACGGGPYVRVECGYQTWGSNLRNCTTVTYQEQPDGWGDLPDCNEKNRPPNPRASVFCRPA